MYVGVHIPYQRYLHDNEPHQIFPGGLGPRVALEYVAAWYCTVTSVSLRRIVHIRRRRGTKDNLHTYVVPVQTWYGFDDEQF